MLTTKAGIVSKLLSRVRWRPISAAVLVAMMLLTVHSPGAVAPPPPQEIRVNFPDPGDQVFTRVAAGLRGEIYAAYFDRGGPNLVLAADVDGIYPEGIPVITQWTIVNDGGPTVFSSPFWVYDIVVGPAGDIYAVWADTRDFATTGLDIRVARSDNQGMTFGPSTVVSDFAAINWEMFPSIAVSPTGDVWVTWTDNRDGDFDIFVSMSADKGLTWSPNVKLNTDTTLDQMLSRLAFDSFGSLYIVWTDQRSGTPEVYMDYTRDSGGSWAGNFKVPVMSTATILADIAVDPLDTIHIAWRDLTTGIGVYYTQSRNRGSTFFPSVRLDDASDQVTSVLDIATDDVGDVYISWMDFDGASYHASYVKSWNWGVSFTSENWLMSNVESPTATIDRDLNVIWGYERDEGAPTNYEAFLLLWDRAPRPVKGLTATELAIPGWVRLQWLPNLENDMKNYMVYKLTPNPWNDELVAILPATKTSLDLSGFTNGEYTYGVAAVDIAGYEAETTYVTFTVGPTLEDLILALQNEIFALRNDTAALRIQIGDLQNEITNLRNDIANLQNNVTSLQNDILNLQTAISNLQTQITSLQNDIANMQSQMNGMQNQIDWMNTTMRNSMNGMQTDITNLQTQVTSLQNQINSVRTDINQVNTSLQTEINKLEDQNNALKDQLTTVKSDMASGQNLNMILLVIVLVVSIISMVLSLRKPKMKVPEPSALPPPPQQYMEQPPQMPP